jgi:acyl-CoA synthetase (AMP-forming)/AMP-acid ligase II
MLRTEPDFFGAFFGVLVAGAVPVPIYPPTRPARLEEYAARHAKILAWLPRRAPITITVGAPIAPREQDWREMVRLRDATRAEIGRGLAERAA